MSRYQTISVHDNRFNYELDVDLVLNHDSQTIEFIYKDPETLEKVQETITADTIKYYGSARVEKIQSVISCKLDNQPLLLIIGLDGHNVNHIYWYNVLKKRFRRHKLLRPIKGEIAQACISPVPFYPSYKSSLGDSSTESVYIMVISTHAGQNTLLMLRLDKISGKPTLNQEEFTGPKDLGHVTAICILPADDHGIRKGHSDPRIVLGFSQGNILIYRLRSNLYAPRMNRLRSQMDISEFAEFPGYPITQVSCARLYNDVALTVAFAQEKPTGDAKYKYAKPYIKLVETHGDLTVKQRKIINPPVSSNSPSIIEVKLIPTGTTSSNSTLQLSAIFFDQLSGQYDLNIWHVSPGKITEALSLQMDQLACLRTLMHHKSVRQSLKFSANGYLLNKPQKIASIILLENKDKDQSSSSSEESEQEALEQEQQNPESKQEKPSENEEQEVLSTKRVRRLIIRHKSSEELSATSSVSAGEEDGRKRRKRNKRAIIPIVVAHGSPTNSSDEDGHEEDAPSVITATYSSAEPSSSIAVLENEDTNMQEYVEQEDQINDADETSQRDTLQSGVPENDGQQPLKHDTQLQKDQQISVNKDSSLLQENQSEKQDQISTQSMEDEHHVETEVQPTELNKPVKEKRHFTVEKLESIEVEVPESAEEDFEPEEIQTDENAEDKLEPVENYTYVDKVDETINSENISTANIDENDGDYDQYDTYDPTASDDDYVNYDVKADFVSIPKNNDEAFVILSSDDEEEEAQSQDEEEINDIVNHAVSEPLRVDEDQRETSLVIEEDGDPLMSHSLLNQGEIQFISGGELYIGTDQASTTTTTIPETETQSSLQPSLDYIPVSNDDLLRLLTEPVAPDANLQESDATNDLLSMLMEDPAVNHSVGGTPALSVDFPITTLPNATAASSPSSPQSTTEPPMTEEEGFEARMSKIALDVAQMCFETSEIDLDTLSSEKQDQMGQYCWESNDHELKLFMMLYCHGHDMSQAVVMLGRSLLSEKERGYMSTKEAKACKSILKRHLFNVHPSLRDGVIINPFSEQSRRDMLQMRNSYFKQESSISSSFYQSEQGKPYVNYYGFGTKPF